MARSSVNLSLCLAGLISCLSAKTIEAGASLDSKTNSNKKLYHERIGSQIEEIFRRLPSVENEVDSVFEDASFFSSFEASPPLDEKSNRDVEDLFRRILLSEEKAEDRDLSFLSEHLDDAGVLGGEGIRNRGGVRGATSGAEEQQIHLTDEDSAIEDSETEGEVRVIGKSSKSGKSDKASGGHHKKDEKEHKAVVKKGKRYKEEKAKVDHKLQKSTKSGKKEKNFSYDPNEGDDDHGAINDDFDFGNWEWEFVDEEPAVPMVQDQVDNPFEEANSPLEENTFGGIKGWRSEPEPLVPQNGVGDMMGRIDQVTEEGQYQFSNFLSTMEFAPVDPVTLTTKKVGHYTFNFPNIQHTVFSGPIHLKAHSNVDLSSKDPEIFDVLQSILTPYLQQTMGDELHAYNLEVDYSPGHDENVDKSDVVTLMKVKCTFKVVSDSIESFRRIDHTLASRWIQDFFTGPGRYNVNKVIEALNSNNIPVNDIAFINQEFEISNTVSQANSQSFGNPRATNKNSEKSSNGAAMVGVTLSVLIVGMLFFMHYTGRLPSKARIGEFSLNTRDSIKHHSLNARDSIKKRMPTSIQLGKKKRGVDDDDMEGGRRRRTFSGTFRRFPVGGLQKAAIQKKPAKSEHYLGDSASEDSSSNRIPKFGDIHDHDDYSFSHYGGDYGPGTPSRQTSVPMTPVSRQSDDEFSMPDTYDSVHERRDGETLLGKMMSPMGRKQQNPYAIKSPIPSRAPRRVTANDIASPNDVDNWSIDSYETPQKTPSNHPLYRGWNESGSEMRRPVPVDPPDSRRENLSMPTFFS